MIRNLLSLGGAQIASRLIGIVAFAYLARALAPAGYGAVELAAGLAAFGASIIEGGSSAIGVRRLVNDRPSAERIAAEVLGTQILLAVAIALLIAAGGALLIADAPARLLTTFYAASLIAVPCQQTWLFQAAERAIGASATIRTLRMALFGLGVMLVVREPGHLVRVGVVEMAVVAITGVMALALQHRLIVRAGVILRPRVAAGLVRESLPVSATNLIWGLELYAPLVLVAAMSGFAAGGHFGVAHRFSLSLATLSFVYHFNLYPTLARAAVHEPTRLAILVNDSFRVTGWSGILAASALTLAAGPLLALTFGVDYTAAVPLFQILVWLLPVTLLADHGHWALIAHGGEKAIPRAHLPGVLITLGAGPLLIHRFDALGGAIVMLLSAMVVGFVLCRRAQRHVGHLPLADLASPLLLAALAMTVARWSPLSPWATAVVSATGMLLLAPLMDRELLSAVRRLARSRPTEPSSG